MGTNTAMELAIQEICDLVDKAYAEGHEAGVEQGYDEGFAAGRKAVHWAEYLLYLSCSFALLVVGAFWVGRWLG